VLPSIPTEASPHFMSPSDTAGSHSPVKFPGIVSQPSSVAFSTHNKAAISAYNSCASGKFSKDG
jgi:hypothetical protein